MSHLRTIIILGLSICTLGAAFTEESKSMVDLVPLPRQVIPFEDGFTIQPNTRVFVEKGSQDALRTGQFLTEWLNAATGYKLKLVETEEDSALENGLLLTTQDADEGLGAEGYELSVKTDGVVIRAGSGAGLFYGMQTLRQLLPAAIESGQLAAGVEWTLPGILVEDSPRYSWRGMHLDVARHFFSKEFLKKFIDLMAHYKLNQFHLHLTDDQGWRVEIKRFPRLTEEGAWRDEIGWRLDPASSTHYNEDGLYGGYYTQEDIREIVAYAAERHITIIPEIDIPGHSLTALTVFPELSCTGEPEKVFCAGNDTTYAFLEEVFVEIAELFPGPWIHIGADEVFKGLKWGDCARCQKRIADEGLKDTHGLQSYFSRRMEKVVNKLGKRMIGWDEVYDDELTQDATIMAWRGTRFGLEAAQKGHDVVMAPSDFTYFDYTQGDNRFEPRGRTTRQVWLPKVYSYDPTPSDLPPKTAGNIIGVQGNLWSELFPNGDHVEYMALPRMCALAEVAWTQPQHKNWDDFQGRLYSTFPRLEEMGCNYRLPNPETPYKTILFSDETAVTFQPAPDPDVKIRYTMNRSIPEASSPLYEQGLAITQTSEIRASYFNRYGRQSPPTAVQCIKSEPIQPGELEQGLAAQYAEGSWKKMTSLKDVSSAELKKVDGVDLGIRQRDEAYTIHFTGYLQVEEAGLYTLTLGSDGRSTLSIGSRQVLENDGRQRYKESSGDLLAAAGLYSFSVGYLEFNGGDRLQVFLEGPGLEKQEVPSTMLYRKQEK